MREREKKKETKKKSHSPPIESLTKKKKSNNKKVKTTGSPEAKWFHTYLYKVQPTDITSTWIKWISKSGLQKSALFGPDILVRALLVIAILLWSTWWLHKSLSMVLILYRPVPVLVQYSSPNQPSAPPASCFLLPSASNNSARSKRVLTRWGYGGM